MKHLPWIVRLASPGRRRYVTPKVEIGGAPVTELVAAVIEKIADVATFDDGLNDAWLEYVTARRNWRIAEEEGIDGETLELLEGAVDDARAAVMAELPTSISVGLSEAQQLAGELDEVAGRVGSVAA